MAISSVSSSVNIPTGVQPQTQAAPAKEVKNDKDKDDASTSKAAQATTTPPRPTVNTSGQIVGSVINTQA